MSENHFYNDDFDFEHLIKQKSDQFKMYPSAQAWKGIHNALHTPLSWYVTGLFLIAAAITLYVLDPFTPSSKSIAQQKPLKSQSSKNNHTSTEEASIIPFSQSAIISGTKMRKKLSDFNEEDILNEPSADENIVSNVLSPYSTAGSLKSLGQVLSTNGESTRTTRERNFGAKVIPLSTPLHQFENSSELQEGIEVDTYQTSNQESDVSRENVISANPDLVISEDEPASKFTLQKDLILQSIAKPKVARSSWQISVSPTMNFRLLKNNTEVITASNNQVIPIALKVKGDVNQYVKHMPAVGMEVSSLYLFNINPRWTFKVGGQFNFSRYYIQAFNTNVPEIAKINLGTSPAGIGTTPITSYSKIRNLSGNSYKGIQNQYYQVSAPVGFEYVLLGKRKLQLNVAGTLQPTFLLNRNSYLITTDYKNYTRQPSLVRQWNMNTSGEAFISYKATHYKFQLGPQFRYQMFSTFEQKYPIKEYLMEYGVKFAVTR